MKWIFKPSLKFTIFGGLWAAMVVRFALIESGREDQFFRYIIPILIGSALAFIIGKTREMDE